MNEWKKKPDKVGWWDIWNVSENKYVGRNFIYPTELTSEGWYKCYRWREATLPEPPPPEPEIMNCWCGGAGLLMSGSSEGSYTVVCTHHGGTHVQAGRHYDGLEAIEEWNTIQTALRKLYGKEIE